MRGPPAWVTLAAASAPMAVPSWRMALPVPCTCGVEQVLSKLTYMIQPAWCLGIAKGGIPQYNRFLMRHHISILGDAGACMKTRVSLRQPAQVSFD